jgi:hypothetical protein
MRLVVRVHPIPPLLGLFHINRARPTSSSKIHEQNICCRVNTTSLSCKGQWHYFHFTLLCEKYTFTHYSTMRDGIIDSKRSTALSRFSGGIKTLNFQWSS